MPVVEGVEPIPYVSDNADSGLRIRSQRNTFRETTLDEHRITLTCQPPFPPAIEEAARLLQSGSLAILPTDTVYGVCASIRDDEAVRGIYAAKGKGPQAPLQLLFADVNSVFDEFATPSPVAARLVDALGPGGWTIIVTAVAGWTSPALAGGSTVGFRVPNASVVRDVVRALGFPLAASSANRHGGPSPTTCGDAVAQVGEACAIALDDGPTPAGLDSTVIDCSTDEVRILREGAIDRHTIARILGLNHIPVLRSVRP